MIGLFDRKDGRAADWPTIADALFRAGFMALDEIPDGHAMADPILKRVHDAAYNRIVKNDDAARPGVTDPAAPQDGGAPVRLPRHPFNL